MVHWPGRLQVVQRFPLVMLDVAHNPAGAKMLTAALGEFLPGKKISFVLGVQDDKEHGKMVKQLSALAKKVYLTRAQWKGAEDPKELVRECEKAGISYQICTPVK